MPGNHAYKGGGKVKKGYKHGGKVKAGAGGGAGRMNKAKMARRGSKVSAKGASK